MQLNRFPGGKSKLTKPIVGKLSEISGTAPRQYREPFVGGGSVALAMLKHPYVNNPWINDKDPGIAALFTSVAQHPDRLIERIKVFTPAVDAFYAFKAELLTVNSVPTESDALVDLGFKKLALNRISHGGLGTMAGGPLGGRSQSSNDKIDSRWPTSRLCRTVNEIHSRFAVKNVTGCTCLDFAELIEDETCPALFYLDPPYVVQGDSCYQYAFAEQDHLRLAECLRKTPHPWVLSYDDCALVRDLYWWAKIEQVPVKYSVSVHRRRTHELLITPSKVRNKSYAYVLAS